MKEVTLYTDGACKGNPGPGGYGAVIDEEGRQRKELSGSEPRTTNNRMEMMAVIKALESLPSPSKVQVVTDSQYVLRGMTEWMRSWLRRGWKSSSGQPVKNRDLWENLLKTAERHQVSWQWIRGHAGHPENERADYLARQAIEATDEG